MARGLLLKFGIVKKSTAYIKRVNYSKEFVERESREKISKICSHDSVKRDYYRRTPRR